MPRASSEVEVRLPGLHADQRSLMALPGRRKAVRCGRRWGKSTFIRRMSCIGAIEGKLQAIFAPDYKRLNEMFDEINASLLPVRRSSSKVDKLIRTVYGGSIEFWTLEDESAGRSRKYHDVFIDEAAFTKPNMMAIWEQSIEPTLLDYSGTAWALSNTNGEDAENFFWQICTQEKHGFVEHHAPSMANPLVPKRLDGEDFGAWQARRDAVFSDIKAKKHPLVWRQEYLAEFVDFSGDAFFAQGSFLIDGQPVDPPMGCDAVFAVLDTAVKTGREHDGTAVVYCALQQSHPGYQLVILDYDVVQIEGAFLETWLPGIYTTLEAMARDTGARMGSLGTWIEDKASGSILLQQAANRGWVARAIDSRLTAMGKDERAINASGAVFRGQVKLARAAFDRVVVYKGTSRNQLIAQVCGFRVGDKTPNRQDDLLDAFTYSISIALGNNEGF